MGVPSTVSSTSERFSSFIAEKRSANPFLWVIDPTNSTFSEDLSRTGASPTGCGHPYSATTLGVPAGSDSLTCRLGQMTRSAHCNSNVFRSSFALELQLADLRSEEHTSELQSL